MIIISRYFVLSYMNSILDRLFPVLDYLFTFDGEWVLPSGLLGPGGQAGVGGRPRPGRHAAADDVHRHREDDRAIVLCGDAVEGLEVAELQGGRTVGDHLGRLAQRPARLVLPLGRDNLKRNKKYKKV